MTLNFSRRAIFPVKPSEEVMVSPVRNTNNNGCFFEGISEKKHRDEYGKPRYVTWELEDSYVLGKDRSEKEGCWEPVANDILELVPLDPFDMGVTATFAAMTSWVDGCETDILNVFWDKGVKSQAGNSCVFERSNPFDGFDGCAKQYGKELGNGESVSNPKELGNGGWVLNSRREEFGNDEECCVASQRESEMGSVSSSDGNEGEPNDALLFCFSYLGVQDLLSMQHVCRSLCFAVQNDVLPWRSIHINHTLNERITDDALLQLTNKAQGHLQSLSLVDCLKITDDGLKGVLDRNPRLTKLNLSGCTRISVDGIISNLKAFKSSATLGIKRLRIGERYGITQRHFAELKSLIGAEECMHPKTQPHFYSNGHSSLSFEDDRSIDIEMCPRCQNLRLVYDCPADSCQAKQSDKQPCRACIICIARCIECGRCIHDIEYEETFCLDLLCTNCWKQQPSSAESDWRKRRQPESNSSPAV